MPRVDWSKGFRIESDGTVEGTKIYDAEGEQVARLTYFELRLAVDKELPFIETKYGHIPFDERDTDPDIDVEL